MSATERLDIYAEGYFVRLAGALAKDFPALYHALGDYEFKRLTAHYLKEYPSRWRNIDEIGANLAPFLVSYPLSRDRPYLPDLAAVEWAVLSAFWADDVPRLDTDLLKTIPDAAWAEAVFEIDPSVQLFRSEWPIDDIWNVRSASAPIDCIEPSPRKLIVFRRDLKIAVERLESSEFEVLQEFASGRSFEEVAERLALLPASTSELVPWFEGWISRGLICSVKFAT